MKDDNYYISKAKKMLDIYGYPESKTVVDYDDAVEMLVECMKASCE